jgi:hypothetical protein
MDQNSNEQSLDQTLRSCAELCYEFENEIRAWSQAVFSGQIAFDPEVESVLRNEGTSLLSRALYMMADSRKSDVPCYVLEGNAALAAATFDLSGLLCNWVSPRLSVRPFHRRRPAAIAP